MPRTPDATHTPAPGTEVVIPGPTPKATPLQDNRVKVVQWNIERGYKLPAIVQILKALDADVLCLQELDIGCARTDFTNVPVVLAQELGMTCLFYCEFDELEGPAGLRLPENAAGPNARHGNAILTRLKVSDHGVEKHSRGMDWEAEGNRLREPRRGHRGFQWARLELPGTTRDSAPRVLHVYNAHLEVFCGASTRVHQFLDLVRCADRHHRELDAGRGTVFDDFYAVFCGDFNTMAHGIVKLSSKYARDHMRFALWGETEGEWFGRHLIDPTRSPFCTPVGQGVVFGWFRSAWFSFAARLSAADRSAVQRMLECFPLHDPFDVYNDVTLNHPTYRGFVQGKLDWLLSTSQTMRPIRYRMFNMDFAASDHRGLVAEYELVDRHDPVVRGDPPVRRLQQPWYRAPMRVVTQALMVVSVAWFLLWLWLTVGEWLPVVDAMAPA
jgi:endonuclease/exonuclease/phosphatase family metal-dependent hydrolase